MSARNQQTVTEIYDLSILAAKHFYIGRHTCNASVLIDSHVTVFQYLETVFFFRIEDMSFVDPLHSFLILFVPTKNRQATFFIVTCRSW